MTGSPGGPADFDLEQARRSVEAVARRTPLLPAPELRASSGADVWLKAECLQVTGSFKVRGAAARLGALSAEDRRRGVIACSSGNHGRAVAHVAERLGIRATIYVPAWVDPVKLAGMRASGADVVLAGSTFDEAEAVARTEADAGERIYVSAYDDPWVIAGQATIGREILEQLPVPPAAVLAPLSGGGLIGGIALALAAQPYGERPRSVAVSAARAAVMRASLEAGRPIEVPEEDTLASALAGGIGLDNRWSFALVRDRGDAHVTVAERAIADTMRWAVMRLRLVVEGGGAVALAALRSGAWVPDEDLSGPIVVVLSGGNVSAETLARVLRGV